MSITSRSIGPAAVSAMEPSPSWSSIAQTYSMVPDRVQEPAALSRTESPTSTVTKGSPAVTPFTDSSVRIASGQGAASPPPSPSPGPPSPPPPEDAGPRGSKLQARSPAHRAMTSSRTGPLHTYSTTLMQQPVEQY